MALSRTYTTQKALELLADRGYDTTARVLRHIEDKLDIHVQRDGLDDKANSLYTESDIELLEQVLTLQKAGLRLVEIRAILLDRDYTLITFQADSLRNALTLLENLAEQALAPAGRR